MTHSRSRGGCSPNRRERLRNPAGPLLYPFPLASRGRGELATLAVSDKSCPPMSDTPRPGILPCQAIEALIAGGAITADTPFEDDQVQPASLDLRLAGRAWRVRA